MKVRVEKVKKLLFGRVGFLVVGSISAGAEPLVADGARERPVAAVHPFVCRKLARPPKLLAAVSARARGRGKRSETKAAELRFCGIL